MKGVNPSFQYKSISLASKQDAASVFLCVGVLPQSLFALFRCELIEGLGLILSKKRFMVIIKVICVVMVAVAKQVVMNDTVLLVDGGFTGSVHHAQRKTHDQRPQRHTLTHTHTHRDAYNNMIMSVYLVYDRNSS